MSDQHEDGDEPDDKVIEVDFGGGDVDEGGESSGTGGAGTEVGSEGDSAGETIDITDELGESGPQVHAVFPEQSGDPESEVKLEVFSDMIEQGVVMVTLDARRDGVEVPAKHEGDARLNLNFSHGFQVPDFTYDSDGVRASLLFDGRDVWCDVPWEAVYMLHSQGTDEIVQFPSSMPEEILEAVPELKHVLAELEELGDLGELEVGDSSGDDEDDGNGDDREE